MTALKKRVGSPHTDLVRSAGPTVGPRPAAGHQKSDRPSPKRLGNRQTQPIVFSPVPPRQPKDGHPTRHETAQAQRSRADGLRSSRHQPGSLHLGARNPTTQPAPATATTNLSTPSPPGSSGSSSSTSPSSQASLRLQRVRHGRGGPRTCVFDRPVGRRAVGRSCCPGQAGKEASQA